ncbi:MAG: hypothetical protein AAGL18_09365 [Pseudomonadota bacterium]
MTPLCNSIVWRFAVAVCFFLAGCAEKSPGTATGDPAGDTQTAT